MSTITETQKLVQPVFAKEKTVVKLTKTGLIKDKENGLTNKEMAKKYNLSVASLSKALKITGLSNIRAKTKSTFEIVEEEVVDGKTEGATL